MRIVQVNAFHYPFYGGIEHRMHHICRRLGKRHEVFVLTSQLAGTPAREEMDNYTVVRLPSRFLHIYNPPYAKVRGTAEAIQELRPDLVDLHYRWAPSLTKGVLSYAGPKVYTCHNTIGEGVGLTHYLSAWNDKAFFKKMDSFDRVVCVSEFMRKDVEQHGVEAKKLITIHNGVDMPSRSSKDGDYILSLGRIVRLKGLEYLIQAMREVSAPLVICGDGPDRKRLERLTAKLGLSDKVSFTGRVSEEEKAQRLAECRCFAVPSTQEAYGLVAAEAMSYGKPVIASDVGGLPEVVGDAGLLVPSGDVSALSKALISVTTDGELRSRVGQAAKSRVAQFSWDDITRRTEELYEGLVRG